MKPAHRKIGSRHYASIVGIVFLLLTTFPSTACAQSAGTFTATGNMTTARSRHIATLLRNGRVLIAGGGSSAELYDPFTKTFTLTGSMTTSRFGPTATLLDDGKVLIAGGATPNGIILASAELYDPLTGIFTRTGNMISARSGHTSTLLNDGRVLIAGGIADTSFVSAEIYNPSTGTFAKTGDMVRPRSHHTATLLNDGRVLIAGVYDDTAGSESEDELFNPSTGTFSRNRKGIGVQQHSATLLNDGMVLFVGGSTNTQGEYSGGILYEPSSDSYVGTGVMIGPTGANSLTPHGRGDHTATLLRDGRVLITGGTKLICGTQLGSCHLISDASTEIYDPATRTFSSLGEMTVPRAFQTATLLSDGTVLIAGGASGTPPEFGGLPTASAEIYTPFASVEGLPQPGIITTYAGPTPPVDGGLAIQYALDQPSAVVSDRAGGFYVVSGHRVYRVTSDGLIRAVAGNGKSNYSGDGGIATSAQLDPVGLAVDTSGNLYISDSGNNRIRKVTSDGVIQTVAGNGTYGFSGDGGPATSAQLRNPYVVAVDTAGNLYFSDGGNNRIRKVTLDGVIRTVAGNGTYGYSGDGGLATSGQIWGVSGLAVDTAGNLYLADSVNNRIRKVTPDGVIQTIAGNGAPGFSGDGGLATSAQLERPEGIGLDAAGNLYILTSNPAFSSSGSNRIRKVTLDGVIHTVAGNGTIGFGGDGASAISAQFSSIPRDLAIDAIGNLYIADTGNNRVRKVTLDGVIRTAAGNGTFGFSGDGGPAAAALFDTPLGIAMDAAGNLYIADAGNNRVRKVTPDRVVSTVAGNGISGFSGDGGAATDAHLSSPYSVAVDAAGNLYIADFSNHIRRVTPDGVIRTFAGNGISGFSGDGGPATSASFSSGSGMTLDAVGNLYIADSGNGRVRKVTTGGVISTIYVGHFNRDGIAVDAIGNLYIATFGSESFDSYSITVRKVTPDGVSRILFFSRDFGCDPTSGITVDSSGNIYLFYGGSYGPVIKITPAGVYSSVAGGGDGTAGDGGLSTFAEFYGISGIATDAAGNLFITDGSRIRRVEFGLIVSSVTPDSGRRGNVVQVSLNGAKFDSSMVINPIADITVSNLTLVSPTLATAIFTIAAAAVPGARNITVTTSGGTSNAITFTVNPPPSLSLLTPPVGVPGTSVAMTLRGTGFASDLFVDAGSEITVSNISVTSLTSAVATFTISSTALLGAHDVTVTTTNGTSTPAALNVVLPFPDLAITSTHAMNFGVGFTETYNILVRNVGLVPTTGVMTITDVLPSGFTYASGGGVTWSCSAVGQALTCVNSGIQAAGASTNLDIAVVVSSAAAPGVVHTISVGTADDVNPSNDSATDLTTVAPTPAPIFAINPSPIRAGSQATLGLTLSTAFPHEVTGEVTMGFSSNAAIPLDDPAIQFASGGRQITFVIPANAQHARFEGNSTPGPVGFQAGTVSGALSFSGTLQAGTVHTTFSPSSSVASSLTIPRQAPLIQNVETTTQNGFGVVINLWSTMREVTQMSLTFSTNSAVTLNCGSVPGCSVSGPAMTFDVRSLFDAWFSSDTKFGSLTTLHLPFSISGTVHGTVAVRLGNSLGFSKPASFPLP
jgi:uncharacterized repeat protein (TIGR01451 family)